MNDQLTLENQQQGRLTKYSVLLIWAIALLVISALAAAGIAAAYRTFGRPVVLHIPHKGTS